MQRHKPYRVLISGGGTGGHIFPAIAIANALRKFDVRTELLFVGANGRMEMQKVPEAGYKIIGLNIAGIQRGNMLKNLGLPFKILSSLVKAGRIIKEFKPEVVVGVGGYASGPTLFMASRMGIPTLIQEQNSFAGVANKLMSKRADRFCVAYEGMEQFFPEEKIVKTGNPVREDIAKLQSDKAAAMAHFGLDPSRKTLLVIGGSLGARTINESIAAQLQLLNESGIQVLWQTGKSYFQPLAEAATPYQHLKVHEFIKRMDYAYDAADVIVSRAGAISISELSLVGKPVILVPSPNVAEDHQTHNALALTEKQAAIMIKDAEAKEKLVSTALHLLEDATTRETLGKNISKLAIADAADRIAKEIISLIP
ncbi:MAG: undecaprenyldiphospho-muramoylpentapeptide beta-N-acetylglucosaminyltransferase [Chitinophagales bacterium]|nr:undecaprenyldiphospho-muramoylpentapeptide beta-N-acetylglucosaminyltransferase [Chitinophagales bacterium]